MITKSARLRAEAKEISRGVKEMGDNAKNATHDRFSHVRAHAADCCEQKRDKVRGAAFVLEKSVLDQPAMAVLIAVGVGLLIGRFCKRR